MEISDYGFAMPAGFTLDKVSTNSHGYYVGWLFVWITY